MIDRDPKQDAKAVKAFARKVLNRVRAAGDAITDLEDIEQELWFAWAKATESFDASKGAAFPTYLVNGMRLHINRVVLNQVTRRHDEVTALSADYVNPDQPDGGSLGDAIADDSLRADQILEREDHFAFILDKLNPDARAVVQILADQPEELLAEVRRITARADYGRERGVPVHSMNYLTMAMVYDALGFSRAERRKLNQHIQATVEAYGQR